MAVYAILSMTILSCNQQQEYRPERKTIRQAVFASGYLEQEDEYVLAASADGTIQELTIHEGDNISAGQTLARIKSDVPNTQLREAQVVYSDAQLNTAANAPQLSQIQTQINLARTQLQQDKLNFQRYAELRVKNSVSEVEFEKAELQYRASQSNLQVLEKSYRQAQEKTSRPFWMTTA